MKLFLRTMLMIALSCVVILGLGRIIAEDYDEIKDEVTVKASELSDNLDARLDETVKFIDEKMVEVYNKTYTFVNEKVSSVINN